MDREESRSGRFVLRCLHFGAGQLAIGPCLIWGSRGGGSRRGGGGDARRENIGYCKARPLVLSHAEDRIHYT